ncbi:hypothetical protein KY284_026233 [Solanum tuberosum]|nr:hypothetical protein KY284_026233 [Solanum tuberosum]
MEAKSLTTYFMEFKKTYKELNVLLPFSTNIKILSSSEISSLKDVFSRVLHIESTSSNQQINMLIAKGGGGKNNVWRWNNDNDAWRWNNNNKVGRWNNNKDVGKWNHNNDDGMWNNNNNVGRWNNNK